jgi:site-specific recombinase XerD
VQDLLPDLAVYLEAAQLTIADLPLAHPPQKGQSWVTVMGKGRKIRPCPLWPAGELSLLIQGRALAEHVFLNRRGQPLTRFGIHALVKRYVRRVSTKMPALASKRISPHPIRHTAATHLLRSGVNINTIRGWLAHLSLDTTHIYAESDFLLALIPLFPNEQHGVQLLEPLLGDGYRG